MLTFLLNTLTAPANIIFISDILLIWFGVFTGLMTKNFYSKEVKKYVEYLMKIKNYKHYSYIFMIFFTLTNVFMTILCMGIITYFKMTNIWFKLVLGLFSGIFGFDVIRVVANVGDKGDSFPELLLKVIKAFFGKGISITLKASASSEDDEKSDKIDDAVSDIEKAVNSVKELAGK